MPQKPPRYMKKRVHKPSSIQTLLSPPEFHRFVPKLAGYTAGWDFHPTLKFLPVPIISRKTVRIKWIMLNREISIKFIGLLNL